MFFWEVLSYYNEHFLAFCLACDAKYFLEKIYIFILFWIFEVSLKLGPSYKQARQDNVVTYTLYSQFNYLLIKLSMLFIFCLESSEHSKAINDDWIIRVIRGWNTIQHMGVTMAIKKTELHLHATVKQLTENKKDDSCCFQHYFPGHDKYIRLSVKSLTTFKWFSGSSEHFYRQCLLMSSTLWTAAKLRYTHAQEDDILLFIEALRRIFWV